MVWCRHRLFYSEINWMFQCICVWLPVSLDLLWTKLLRCASSSGKNRSLAYYWSCNRVEMQHSRSQWGLHVSCVSVQGLHPSNTTANEGSSFTLLCQPQWPNQNFYRKCLVFVTNCTSHHNAPPLLLCKHDMAVKDLMKQMSECHFSYEFTYFL